MFLQGNLQNVFDALYQMGVIDPVLKKDWKVAMNDYSKYDEQLKGVITLVNQMQDDTQDLIATLRSIDRGLLEYLAMEVAREYADYYARKNLH